MNRLGVWRLNGEVRSDLLGKLFEVVIAITSIIVEEAMIPLKAFDICGNGIFEIGTGRLYTQAVDPPSKLEHLGDHSLTATQF